MNLENEAAYLFITAILKELLEQGLITKAQFRQIDRYKCRGIPPYCRLCLVMLVIDRFVPSWYCCVLPAKAVGSTQQGG